MRSAKKGPPKPSEPAERSGLYEAEHSAVVLLVGHDVSSFAILLL